MNMLHKAEIDMANSVELLVRKGSYFYRSTKRTKDRLTPPILVSSKETVSRFPRELESV